MIIMNAYAINLKMQNCKSDVYNTVMTICVESLMGIPRGKGERNIE